MAVTVLFEFPSAIAEACLHLFFLKNKVILFFHDFKAYWPHIDNVWFFAETSQHLNERRTVYYCCCLHNTKNWVLKEGEKRVRQRMKPSRTAVDCEMCMCIVFHEDHVTVSCTTEHSQHSYTLEDSDQFKRPSHFWDLAAAQVVSGYKVVKVARNLHGVNRPANWEALLDTKGHWLFLKNIHNASAAWRKQHSDLRMQENTEAWVKQHLTAQKWLKEGGWNVTNIEVISSLFF